jgi:hypothetical protein
MRGGHVGDGEIAEYGIGVGFDRRTPLGSMLGVAPRCRMAIDVTSCGFTEGYAPDRRILRCRLRRGQSGVPRRQRVDPGPNLLEQNGRLLSGL